MLFASEAKAFLAHPAFTAAIDEDHVDEHLAFRYVAGEASLLKGVRQLRPGHRLRIAPDGVTTTRYWSIPDGAEKARLTREEAIDRLDALMRHSVASQLLSDVKVGCQLSGGIDSSLVTVFARSHFGAGMDTFSVVFDDPKFSEDPLDPRGGRDRASREPSIHVFRSVVHRPARAGDVAHGSADQPSQFARPLAARPQARDRVTVLLSGEGADEVFGGYTRFADAHQQPAEAFIQATQFQPASKLARLRPSADLAPALARRMAIFNEGGGDHLSNCLKYDMQTYLVDLLVRQDKMTMAHGVENRVPFLDRGVVDFARTLPPEHLVGDPTATSAALAYPSLGEAGMRSTKVVVKELARRTFDDAFVYRPKGGFNLPLSQYFRSTRFTELMEDQLLPGMQAARTGQ